MRWNGGLPTAAIKNTGLLHTAHYLNINHTDKTIWKHCKTNF